MLSKSGSIDKREILWESILLPERPDPWSNITNLMHYRSSNAWLLEEVKHSYWAWSLLELCLAGCDWTKWSEYMIKSYFGFHGYCFPCYKISVFTANYVKQIHCILMNIICSISLWWWVMFLEMNRRITCCWNDKDDMRQNGKWIEIVIRIVNDHL